jgi:hypothetical protein
MISSDHVMGKWVVNEPVLHLTEAFWGWGWRGWNRIGRAGIAFGTDRIFAAAPVAPAASGFLPAAAIKIDIAIAAVHVNNGKITIVAYRIVATCRVPSVDWIIPDVAEEIEALRSSTTAWSRIGY